MKKDLMVLVADSNMKMLFTGLLPRLPIVSGTRPFTYDIVVHPEHDPGCFNTSHEILLPSVHLYNHVLVAFDLEGCGKEEKTVAELQTIVQQFLNGNGWNERNCAIVISPELENWIWTPSPNVEQIIRWLHPSQSLFEWARNEGWMNAEQMKPSRPKEAFEAALYRCRTPRSSSIYKAIAERVSYQQCTDPAFLRLIVQLQMWFPQSV